MFLEVKGLSEEEWTDVEEDLESDEEDEDWDEDE